MTEQRHASKGVPEFHLNTVESLNGRNKVARRARIITLIILLLLLAGLARTLLVRKADANTLAQQATQNLIQQVRVVHPRTNSHDDKLTLPSTLQGITEAEIHARTSGYVKQWFKDIGQPVKKGDLLAVLDIPDINKQVDEAKANYDLARIAYDRWSKLRAQDAVSQQEFDEKTSTYQQTAAALKRLRDQQDFGTIRAPFDGIVTKRNIDNGSLVNAGNGGSSQALFSIAQVDKLHLYVYVPQDRARQIRVGDVVEVKPSDSGDTPVKGTVARTAGAIDPSTRTLQVEIILPNAEHKLLPGLYVDARLNLQNKSNLTLPTNTLLFGPAGSQVATVDSQNKVKLVKVALGTDYGREVEIKSGLTADDRVIINPSDAISNGQAVNIVATGSKGG